MTARSGRSLLANASCSMAGSRGRTDQSARERIWPRSRRRSRGSLDRSGSACSCARPYSDRTSRPVSDSIALAPRRPRTWLTNQAAQAGASGQQAEVG